MADDSGSSPVFAGRYRFEPVPKGWDTGRSGFTHLVYDLEKKRLGVIKRAEIHSLEAVDGLKNEIKALRALRASHVPNTPNVPQVYETGEAKHGSKIYFYIVIEYIDAMRVENHIDSLSIEERIKILTQLFDLLAKAHQKGIANWDIDLKHLFWYREKKQLIVIDWGNAKLNVNPKKETEFAYDLARSAEVIYSLVTNEGHLPAIGSLELPSNLILELKPIPKLFCDLCKWAHRTPIEGAQSPYTAQELLEAALNWEKTSKEAKPENSKRMSWRLALFIIMAAVIATGLFALIKYSQVIGLGYLPKTPAPTGIAHNISPSPTHEIETTFPVESLLPTTTPTKEITLTPTLTITASPTYTPEKPAITRPVLIFDQQASTQNCWINDTNSPLKIRDQEGFTRRFDKNWRFGIEKDQLADYFLQTDFKPCIIENQVTAFAFNAWIARLDIPQNNPNTTVSLQPEAEFGFFLENEREQRREYTIWIDKSKLLHLRIRENSQVILDDLILVIENDILKIEDEYPRPYAKFPVQFFFELNNQSLDILYMYKGPVQLSVSPNSLQPGQMIRMDKFTFPTLGDINKIGLIGYGGESQVVIWPLVFYGK